MRLAILFDYPEENWPSMDLAAAKLLEGLRSGASGLAVEAIRPSFVRLATALPGLHGNRLAWNADRFFNRFLRYPPYLSSLFRSFDVFHVADHSYAHLVHSLPNGRSGVFCHDLDAFRCLVEPDREPRPPWFRAMARRILRGLQKAAIVFHSTQAVRSRIEQLGILPPERLVHAPYGVNAEFVPESPADERLPEVLQGRPYLLHVGSCVARKRIDVLLEVFSRVRRRHADLRLMQVGGTWSSDQLERIESLGLRGSVVQVRGVEGRALAALYRHAAVLLQPSDAEGFGMPVLEALACGCAVVASDLPVLREVGGEGATYLPVGDVQAWSHAIAAILEAPSIAPAVPLRLAQARRFSWAAHANTVAQAYGRLASGAGGRRR